MPAIKKKWIKASQDGVATTPDDDNDDVLGDDDKDRGSVVENVSSVPSKPKKRPAQLSQQHNLLRGLDAEVLSEKRKRFTPPSELKLSEWLDNNLEKRTEETLYLPHLYKYYTELCQADGSDILDVPEFNRMVKEKFGKSFGVKETSVYKTLIKERKLNQEKKKTGSGIKLKEIVHEAINHFGNPWSGVRFFALKQYIGTKYPALQIDLRPKLLKRALEMGVQYGQIDLVKGIGMAGFYKLPGGEPPPKTKPKSKKEEGDEKSADDSETKAPESAEEDKPEDSTENGEKKDSSEETKKKKKHKHKKAEKISLSKLHHGNPEKMEDIFPLAITYQSAPKAASLPKIRKYIQEKYGETVPDTRWRKAVDSGAERGYWEHVSGSGITGSVHLLMDDFNPASEQIEDRICAAVIACHEPKSASANQIKKYISQYHPDFKVDERPDKFKKALLRAVSKNMIVQLSGLGANGSFQLTSIFTPSPAILAGEDDASEEEGYDSDDEPTYVPRGTKSRGVPKLKAAAAVTVSQKSVKSKVQKKPAASNRGRARPAVSSYTESSDEESEKPVKKQKKSPKGEKKLARAASNKPVDYYLSSDEEVQPEYAPRKSLATGGSRRNATPAKVSKKKAAKSSKVKTPRSTRKADSSDEEKPSSNLDKASKSSYSSDEEKSPPSKATPNKSSRKVASIVKEDPSPAADKKQTPKSSKKPVAKPLTSPPKSQKSAKTTKEAAPLKKKTSVDSGEEDADSELELEYTPRKSKSRGGEKGGSADDTRKPAKKAKGKKSKSRK
ncbi:unnamed protein product [Candidula unifasciata]|uniref:H15 domain-containing protein n=1 Tax=Candidula unifasciata TaxID=100452 RepID=A0A8S3YVJ4_9EUPU|nr:unnamed protein product [Candidula unifasciata]